MRPTHAHRVRRAAHLQRHRPRLATAAQASATDNLKASDLVLAVLGVAVLGAFCLVMASNLLAF